MSMSVDRFAVIRTTGACLVAIAFALPASAHEGIGAWHEHLWASGGHARSIPFIGLALLVALLAIAFVVGRRARGHDVPGDEGAAARGPDPLAELELRFARGEIDEAELERRRRALRR